MLMRSFGVDISKGSRQKVANTHTSDSSTSDSDSDNDSDNDNDDKSPSTEEGFTEVSPFRGIRVKEENRHPQFANVDDAL